MIAKSISEHYDHCNKELTIDITIDVDESLGVNRQAMTTCDVS